MPPHHHICTQDVFSCAPIIASAHRIHLVLFNASALQGPQQLPPLRSHQTVYDSSRHGASHNSRRVAVPPTTAPAVAPTTAPIVAPCRQPQLPPWRQPQLPWWRRGAKHSSRHGANRNSRRDTKNSKAD